MAYSRRAHEDEIATYCTVIERQLAHCERNKERESYKHAQYLPKRREMMDWWRNYIQKYLSVSE